MPPLLGCRVLLGFLSLYMTVLILTASGGNGPHRLPTHKDPNRSGFPTKI